MAGTPGFKVYLITDRRLFPEAALLYRAVEAALRAGIGAVQLREKDLPLREMLAMAYRLREITGRHGARLFVNDRIDVALAIHADGVHLGCESVPAGAARKVVGERMLIGVSTHSVGEAERAEKEGADFVTLGPVYETASKLRYGQPLGADVLRQAKTALSVPVFAIGGITKERITEVREAGADGVAVISAILASDDVKSSAGEFMRLMT